MATPAVLRGDDIPVMWDHCLVLGSYLCAERGRGEKGEAKRGREKEREEREVESLCTCNVPRVFVHYITARNKPYYMHAKLYQYSSYSSKAIISHFRAWNLVILSHMF